MSRVMAAVVRNSEPMPPSPPLLETAAANSADVAEPIGARMIGTSMPSTSHSEVLSILPHPWIMGPPAICVRCITRRKGPASWIARCLQQRLSQKAIEPVSQRKRQVNSGRWPWSRR
jgi:hypothetical protein